MWLFKNEVFDGPVDKTKEGFVYLITQLSTGKKYVGKKSFWTTQSYQKNGIKKKRKIESAWRTYYGSSPRLKEVIVGCGKEDFRREILFFSDSKTMSSYLETFEILKRGALLSDEYFNDWVSCKMTKAHLQKVSVQVGSLIGIDG